MATQPEGGSFGEALREAMYLTARLLHPEERSWDGIQAAKRAIEQLQIQTERFSVELHERESIRRSLAEAHQAFGLVTELQTTTARHQIKAALDHLSKVFAAVEESNA